MPFGLASAQPLDQLNLGAAPSWSPAPADAPAPAAPGPQAGPASPQGYKPSIWDIAQGVIFDGQSPAEAAMAARQRDYQAKTLQQLPELLSKLPPGVRAAALMGGPKVWDELAKNWSPQTRSAGQETDYFGGSGKEGGYTRGTDTYGVDDKSGLPFANGPQGGFRTLGPSLGGDFKAGDGIISSGRTGQITGSYETPQSVAPGNRLDAFLPGFKSLGGASAVGSGGVGPEPGPAPVAGPASGPRGIRNNNFGNVKALSNGHLWTGQVGVDDEGHAIFDTPENGARASLTNLQSYGKEGVNTPSGIARRWAGAKASPETIANYSHALAGAAGVGPDDRLDLSDPKVAKPLLNTIFNFENGAGAMKAWRAPASASGHARTVDQGNEPRPLTDPAERAAWGIQPADRTPYAMGPDHKPVSVGVDAFSPEKQLSYTKGFMEAPQYKDYDQLRRFHDTAQYALTQQGGPADLQILDMALKANNPTLGIRPNQVDQMMDELGLPNRYKGEMTALVQNGQHLSPQARQAMTNVIDNALKSSWRSLQPLLKKADRDATKYGLTREDLIPGLVEPPDYAPAGSGFGTSKTQLPQGGGASASPLDAARAAIAKGAPRDAVAARLRAHGINPAGL